MVYMCAADVSPHSVLWEALCEFALFTGPLGSSDNPSPMASKPTVLNSALGMRLAIWAGELSLDTSNGRGDAYLKREEK